MKVLSLIYSLIVLSLASNLIQASETSYNPLSIDVITTTVNQVSEVLNKNYVYPEVATEMQAFLDQQLLAGKYTSSHTQRELIKRIQSDLRELSSDGHISLLLAEDSVDRTSHVLPKTRSQEAIHTEIISDDGNHEEIGYLRFDKFSGDSETKVRLVQAMEVIATSESLIIDLRGNGGGDPGMVALLSRYFLEDDTRLWSIFNRDGDQVFEARSEANQNKFMGDLCILTSGKTYSAAEAFAYTLKHLGRAHIVGEATGGGAHLVEMQRVNDAIDIRIPVARAYNHITGSNWEGVGVIPDLDVEASDAKMAAIEFLRHKTRKEHLK